MRSLSSNEISNVSGGAQIGPFIVNVGFDRAGLPERPTFQLFSFAMGGLALYSYQYVRSLFSSGTVNVTEASQGTTTTWCPQTASEAVDFQRKCSQKASGL